MKKEELLAPRLPRSLVLDLIENTEQSDRSTVLRKLSLTEAAESIAALSKLTLSSAYNLVACSFFQSATAV